MKHHQKASFLLYILLISSAFFLGRSQNGYCQMVQFHDDGPVHDAFVARVSSNMIYQSSPSEPPENLIEKTPKQLDMQAEWLPGYWAWEHAAKDFVWVSGVWRRAPPGHQWISGFWKNYHEGWVWFPGFWSRTALENVTYIPTIPPDELDQNTTSPASNNYFWIPGYWNFSFDKNAYQWVRGQWEEFDSAWVLIPSHYVWRPGGYVFVPAYWDWPLEDRGTAYASAFIDSAYRQRVPYEPSKILESGAIIRNLYAYYPDYLSVFHHHWHFHQKFWSEFCCVAPWWKWDTWWSFSWKNQWALWWWYVHPGYPQPTWITPELSAILPSPLPELTAMFATVVGPAIVTPEGVVNREQLQEAIKKTTGSFNPILPANRAVASKIFRIAARENSTQATILKPIGRHLPIDPNAVRPIVRKPVVDSDAAGYISDLPDNLRPAVPFKPKIPTRGRFPKWTSQTEKQEVQAAALPQQRLSWTPNSESDLPKKEVVDGVGPRFYKARMSRSSVPENE